MKNKQIKKEYILLIAMVNVLLTGIFTMLGIKGFNSFALIGLISISFVLMLIFYIRNSIEVI